MIKMDCKVFTVWSSWYVKISILAKTQKERIHLSDTQEFPLSLYSYAREVFLSLSI